MSAHDERVTLPPRVVRGEGSENAPAEVHQVMSPLCMRCKRQIEAADGLFIYTGSPYYGVLHRDCAPFFAWNSLWPHEQPYVYYLARRSRL